MNPDRRLQPMNHAQRRHSTLHRRRHMSPSRLRNMKRLKKRRSPLGTKFRGA
jgi:hypothetical protein